MVLLCLHTSFTVCEHCPSSFLTSVWSAMLISSILSYNWTCKHIKFSEANVMNRHCSRAHMRMLSTTCSNAWVKRTEQLQTFTAISVHLTACNAKRTVTKWQSYHQHSCYCRQLMLQTTHTHTHTHTDRKWFTLSRAWRRWSCRKHWMKASSASSL